MNRKNFLKISLGGLAGSLLLPSQAAAHVAGKPSQIAPETVREFVGRAHNDLDCVREMLAYEPNLLNAAWDLGAGDFETGLGGASHVGRRDIVEFLLEKGARADIFTLTMLGETVLVQSLLEKFPTLLNAPGPHGLTLLHHAERGGDAAKALYDYIWSKGLTVKKLDIFK